MAVLSQCADLLSTEDEVSASNNSFYEDGGKSFYWVIGPLSGAL